MSHVTLCLRYIALLAAMTLGFVTIVGKGAIQPPAACPDIRVDLLKKPSGAMVYRWDSSGSGGDHWALLTYLDGEIDFTGDYVTYLPFLENAKGVAFTLWSKRQLVDFGFDSWFDYYNVTYVLEYTVPVVDCKMNVEWSTGVRTILPNGVCFVGHQENLESCSTSLGGYDGASFYMFAIQDPTGEMGVTGPGADLLRDKLDAKHNSQEHLDTLAVNSQNSQGTIQKRRPFKGNFTLEPGIRAHVYFAVSAQVTVGQGDWACTHKCYTLPGDRLPDDATFVVVTDSGDEGVVAVGMSKVAGGQTP